jgi:hypothetical protein
MFNKQDHGIAQAILENLFLVAFAWLTSKKIFTLREPFSVLFVIINKSSVEILKTLNSLNERGKTDDVV